MTSAWTRAKGAVAGLVLGLAAVAGAGGLPKLPADHDFPQGDGSPGKVTFSHATHVDAKAPACVGCHPGRWSMLKPGQAVGLEALKHEAMEKGQACGACHGKQAFGFDSCDLCHK
jgi:c(7)-type cytochrome triheme protein